MQYRTLGKTGIEVSVISFGAGPVSGWVALDDTTQQIRIIERALSAGINWFDTAATYGEGRSETALGTALTELSAHGKIHIATKVRFTEESLGDIRGAVLRTFEASLARLQCSSITLLQLHNSVTAHRGDQPTSITPQDVFGTHGVLDAFVELRAAGVVKHLGFTGLGDIPSMKAMIESGRFATVQTPYNLLNPSAGQDLSGDITDANYGNIFAACQRQQMGVFAIRVFAGGALVGNEPSAHTKITKFFPLDLYERDRQQAKQFQKTLPSGTTLKESAVRFVLDHPAVASAIIGFAQPEEIDEVVSFVDRTP